MNTLHRTAVSITLATLACAAAGQGTHATSTMDKIKATGAVVLGVREASAPMAYALGAHDKFVGYHVELCEHVLKEIAPGARFDYKVLTAQNTMSLVQNGTVDIGCGPTTNNLTRQQQVAFALTSYVSQVRMAVRADSGITSFEQLAGRNVAASTGTTAVQLLRGYAKTKNIEIPTVLGKDHFDSFLMLESGRADAFVLDDNLLAGLIANGRNPTAFASSAKPWRPSRSRCCSARTTRRSRRRSTMHCAGTCCRARRPSSTPNGSCRRSRRRTPT